MAWLRIDDRVRTHPKIVKAGPAAAWFWFCGICYCREHLTDGFIQKEMLNTLAPGVGITAAKKNAAVLVEKNLWHEAEGGYVVHDFLDWNPSKAEVEADREWDRKRKELYSDPDLLQRIRGRDRDCCRYCGNLVNWKDRRGPNGGQFDHVIPRGDNSYENVVVACRRCNIRKNARTPEAAAMKLLPQPIESQIGTSSGSSSGSSTEPDALTRDARGRGLGLGYGSADSGGGAGGTTPGPRPFDRQHASHVFGFCDWVCLPAFLLNEFIAKGGGDEGRVEAWARGIRTQWQGRHIGDNLEFWRARWKDSAPSTAAQSTEDAVKRDIAEAKARRASVGVK